MSKCDTCANGRAPSGMWDGCVKCVSELEAEVARLKAEVRAQDDADLVEAERVNELMEKDKKEIERLGALISPGGLQKGSVGDGKAGESDYTTCWKCGALVKRREGD